MPTSFSRTTRSLDAGGSRRWVIESLIAALLVMWAAWFLLGRVVLYEFTNDARLEVINSSHPVAAPVAGAVLENGLWIGRRVRSGDTLVKLDSRPEQLKADEKRARRDGLRAQQKALEDEIHAERTTLIELGEARVAAFEESRAKVTQAEALAKYAKEQTQRLEQLRRKASISEEELGRWQAEAEAKAAEVQKLSLAAARREKDYLVKESECQTRLARLMGEVIKLDKEAETEEAGIRHLEYEIERRIIRAPVSGRVGEVSDLPAGAVVGPADKLGAIVPDGATRIVARFPAAAIGRIRPGQPACLRMDGFPWTRYGKMPATVAAVGNEPRNGLIRVELTPAPDFASPLPVEHGPPGSVEVEIEAVSPATLVLRAAGQLRETKRTRAAGESNQSKP